MWCPWCDTDFVAPTLGGSVLQELRWLDQQTAHAALMQDWFKAEFSLAIIQAAASSATTAFTEWSAFLRVGCGAPDAACYAFFPCMVWLMA